MSVTPPRPPAPPGSKPTATLTLKPLDLTPRKAAKPVPRIVYYAVEGFGKTTFGCQFPSPVVLAARDEKGVQRLLDSKVVAPLPVIDIDSWPAFLGVLDQLAASPHDRKTVVIDSAAAFERLCHEWLTAEQFDNNPGEGGFLSWGRGATVALSEWAKVLSKLDALNRKGMMIVFLGHAAVEKFKNPNGQDFDRYTCRMDAKAWAAIKSWADCVWFGNYLTITQATAATKGARHKGIGGTDRILYTHRRDTHDAKPGYRMPEEINLPDDVTGLYDTIMNHVFSETQQ